MAKPRQKASGMWEIALRHPSLPGGRKYFTFDTEAQAMAYGEQWSLLKMAGIQPPAELLKPATKKAIVLAHLIRTWANSGLAAPTQHSSLGSLMTEVGAVNLEDATYTWLAGYLQQLKVKNNLAPNSIRHRIQALGRCIDEYLRHNPTVVFSNPVRLLPKGYSAYTDLDKKLVLANGGKAKIDVSRDRRLHKGEQERIVAALSGFQRPDRERGLLLLGGNSMLTMFLVIVYSGLRLKEAYTLKRGGIDLEHKVIQVQSSKQRRGNIAFRDVPMRPEVHAALVHYLATRSMLPGANLFPFMEEESDLPIKKVSSRLSARFTTAFDYADCPGLHEHDLRHEATCRWLEMRDSSGNWMFRSEEINRIMGWSAGSVMAQRYASFRGSDLAARMWATPEAGGASFALSV
ncbi:MAG: tyrosine-type recombinase/integrase [Rhodoferax sp.]|uniref:tyrosine-type recombinase/integrase n=1 Tax=Rhodoferax sp. TaxID=50421 RepID=UPI0017A2DEA2|nr:tyrosine-type recombinase/integrase [Rhodoferax sp.]NMM21543.1 tyrosine-type recombinase/integrase [Rhodoferax sp.]